VIIEFNMTYLRWAFKNEWKVFHLFLQSN
jgi:hypothetical protein